jgi:hypothetical protein
LQRRPQTNVEGVALDIETSIHKGPAKDLHADEGNLLDPIRLLAFDLRFQLQD